jgi:hypothetical protein
VVALLCSAHLKNKCSVQRGTINYIVYLFLFLLLEVPVPSCTLVTHQPPILTDTPDITQMFFFLFFYFPQTNAWQVHSSILPHDHFLPNPCLLTVHERIPVPFYVTKLVVRLRSGKLKTDYRCEDASWDVVLCTLVVSMFRNSVLPPSTGKKS